VGDAVGDVVVVVSEVVAVGLAAGSVVSVFFSHAARSAALARMQMYFFIMVVGKSILLYLTIRSKALFGPVAFCF
jgi:hypothetical protein